MATRQQQHLERDAAKAAGDECEGRGWGLDGERERVKRRVQAAAAAAGLIAKGMSELQVLPQHGVTR